MRRAWILAAASLGVMGAPAGTAAADQQNPFVVIQQLELAGYTVNIDRIGNAPIEDCTVTGVRNPQQVTQPVEVGDRNGHHGGHHGQHDDVDVIDVVVHQSISVSLDCTG